MKRNIIRTYSRLAIEFMTEVLSQCTYCQDTPLLKTDYQIAPPLHTVQLLRRPLTSTMQCPVPTVRLHTIYTFLEL